VPERCCNKLVNARINKKKLETLRTRLRAVKKSVDNAPPASFRLPHLSRNLKKAQTLEDEYQRVESRNRVLLERMSKIADNPSLTTDNHNAYHKWLRSRNFRNRKANRERVILANGHLLERLKTSEAYYDVDAWESDHRRSTKIMKEMMEFEHLPPAKPRTLPKPSLLPDEDAPRVGPGFDRERGVKTASSPKRLPQLNTTKGGGSSSGSFSTRAASAEAGVAAGRGSSRSPSKQQQQQEQQQQQQQKQQRSKGDDKEDVSAGASGSSSSPKKSSTQSKKKAMSVDDEVVELFRFPSLTLRGVYRDVPDSTWNISLFDTMASAEVRRSPARLLARSLACRND
jgi:hypothetical protein